MKRCVYLCIGLMLLSVVNLYGVEKSNSTSSKLQEFLDQNARFQKRCDGGDLNACFVLGKWYLDNPQIPNKKPKFEKAYELFQIACQNEAKFCPKIAERYSFSDDPKKYQRMEEFLLKSCNDKNKYSCLDLANLYATGDKLKQDYPRAREFYAKVCQIDNSSCYSEEYIHEFKLNNNQSLEKFCDEGDMRSCYELGDNELHTEYKIKDDYLNAQKLFQKSCDGGERRGCYALGLMYVSDFWTDKSISKYIPTDYQKGFSLLEKACKDGVINACYYVGWMYKENLGVKNGFFEKSERYFDLACDKGIKSACKGYEGRSIFTTIAKIYDSSTTTTKYEKTK